MNYIGWLAPDGTHFECNKYEHDILTRKILNQYYKIDTRKTDIIDCDDALFNRGWCRIGYQSILSRGYVIQTKWRYITDAQKSFIQNMFFDVGERMTRRTIENLLDYDIIDLNRETKNIDKKLSKIKE